MSAPPLLPVTIVTGFFGAGKTTLVRHLLSAFARERVAVLENELGELAVDDELLAPLGAGRLEIALGRTCRETRGALVRGLYAIAAVAEQFDRLIIETSGVARPGVLAALLFADSALRGRFRLDGIVTVVDAANYPADAGEEGEAGDQIACADAVVLNKRNWVPVGEIGPLLLALRRINGKARYFVTDKARVPADELLNLGGVDIARIESGVIGCREEGNGGAYPGRPIETVAVACRRDLDFGRFRLWMEEFVAHHTRDLFRAKGIVALQGASTRLFIQSVHGYCRALPGHPWGDSPRISRLTFIGRNLDRAAIEEGLAACEVTSSGRGIVRPRRRPRQGRRHTSGAGS